MEETLEKQLPTFEEIAESIQKIADAMEAINRTRVSKELIITLIHAKSKVGKKEIEYVLNNLIMFDSLWLKK